MKNITKLLTICLVLTLLASTATAATLQVGPKLHYKTIQSAVNCAHPGDTIIVNAGTYKETVKVNDKHLIFKGAKKGSKYLYPSVYGFSFRWNDRNNRVGSGDVSGFKIIKTGVNYELIGHNTVRNNYFTDCGVSAASQTCSGNTIINNKFLRGGIHLYESYENVVIGNTFTNAQTGLSLTQGAACELITKNTFKNCKIGVQVYMVPDCLIGNHYSGNKKNIKTGIW